jgi:thiopeptide-type bacteriocin biosynthesis protein
MYAPLSAFVLRAPLLPERRLWTARAALERHALGKDALVLASPELARAKDPDKRRRAVERYARSAAFRGTPRGLLGGVCVGALGAETRVATGRPVAWLAPTWGRMAALGRALLDDDALREKVRLRAAPSLARGATTVRWLGPGETFVEERTAEIDERLHAILDATAGWAPWPRVRTAVARAAPGADALDVDDLLLLLVDDGLLLADVTPPLVGERADLWMRARLTRLGATSTAGELARAVRALDRGALDDGAAALGRLPGAGGPGTHGVLVHRAPRPPALARAAVERAAALAPLLFRLQEALAPPSAERLAQPALDEALSAVTELHGAGALDLAALAAGDYGVRPEGDQGDGGDAPALPSPAALIAHLVDAIVAAERGRRGDVAVAHLDPAALADVLGDVGPAPPPTCELFLSPARRPRGAREGEGWLLGLHAPAGSSWGRHAAALGRPLERALAELARAERDARPGEEALDVAFAPSAALADLAAHGPARRRTLALTTWSDAEAGDRDVALADLELVADPGAARPLALRETGGGAVAPSPLSRVRSTTAPAGAARLLAGWSLHRQHAPWALALGPLAGLARLPRLVLDGFVVAPASWRLPAPAADGRLARTALRRWRRDAGVPRFVQTGHEDQLLPVDLDAPSAAGDLAGVERVWEIWPPLGRAVDRDGRRVEAVVALVARPAPEAAAAEARATAAAGRVPPPRRAAAPTDVRTYKLFGSPEHADAVLLDAVHPAVRAALRAREISRWLFLRYVDGPGRRHHLRLRVRSPSPRARAAFEARLARALEPARQAGTVVTVESAEYHPERARYGAALEPAHAVFQSDSELACALLAEEDADDARAPDRLVQVVRSLDALARGLGHDLEGRRALARGRRDAEARLAGVEDDAAVRAEDDAEFRARARSLRGWLGAPGDGAGARALRLHAERTARATRSRSPAERAALAPALLHLACVRLAGPDRDLERRAYTFWERTLEGLLATRARKPT